MKRVTSLLIFGTCLAVSILCGLFLLLAAQLTAAVASARTSIPLAAAPISAKVLVGLAIVVSGGLLLAPIALADLKKLHKEKSC